MSDFFWREKGAGGLALSKAPVFLENAGFEVELVALHG